MWVDKAMKTTEANKVINAQPVFSCINTSYEATITAEVDSLGGDLSAFSIFYASTQHLNRFEQIAWKSMNNSKLDRMHIGIVQNGDSSLFHAIECNAATQWSIITHAFDVKSIN